MSFWVWEWRASVFDIFTPTSLVCSFLPLIPDDPILGLVGIEDNLEDDVEDDLGSLADVVDVDALSDGPPAHFPVDILEEDMGVDLVDWLLPENHFHRNYYVSLFPFLCTVFWFLLYDGHAYGRRCHCYTTPFWIGGFAFDPAEVASK